MEIFLEILPHIITLIVAILGSSLIMNKIQKKAGEIANDGAIGDQWQELYDEQKERAEYWEKRAEERQNKLDEREQYWSVKCDEKDVEITRHRDEKIQLRNDLMDERVRAEKLDRMKCEVRGCTNRRPPSDFMM